MKAEMKNFVINETEDEDLEMLNRLTRERAERHEMVALAAADHRRQQKKFDAVVRLIVNLAMYATTSAALVTIGYLVTNMSWLFMTLGVGMAMIGAFRTGYIWHDIKG